MRITKNFQKSPSQHRSGWHEESVPNATTENASEKKSTGWWFFEEDYYTDTVEEVFIKNHEHEATEDTDKVEFQEFSLLQKIRDPEYDFTSDWESIMNSNQTNQ